MTKNSKTNTLLSQSTVLVSSLPIQAVATRQMAYKK